MHLSLSWPWQPSFDSSVSMAMFSPKNYFLSFFSWIVSVSFTLYLLVMKDEGEVLAQLIKFKIWRRNDVTLRHVTINLRGQFIWVIWIPGSAKKNEEIWLSQANIYARFTSASFCIVPRTFTNLIMILSKLRKNEEMLIKWKKNMDDKKFSFVYLSLGWENAQKR